MLKIKKFLSAVLIIQMFASSLFAAENSPAAKSEFNLQEIALPSEVKDISKYPSSIFYGPSVKNKVLIPVHMWGEIKQSGLHFIPSDTTLIKGLSLAGGPTAAANLEEIVITRDVADGSKKDIAFDISEGGDVNAHQFKIEAGDTVFVKKNTFYENRNYYTSLINIFITVLSTFFIITKVD